MTHQCGSAAPCQRCARVRPIHGHGFCGPCYGTLRRWGWLPVRLPAGYFACRDCGVPPRALHYGPRTKHGLTRGLCPACYQVVWRRGLQAHYTAPTLRARAALNARSVALEKIA